MRINVNPNYLNDREAMGLPAGFVSRTPATLLGEYRDLITASVETWIAEAESSCAPFSRRYAAGTLLGLIGDPRISPLNPAMCSIPGGKVRLGLDPENVAPVVAQWCHVGVVEAWIAKECPTYIVALKPYALMRYPVTNYEYRLFLEKTGSTCLPTSWTFGVYPVERANHPVWSVPVEAAECYAKWLNAETGREFRLPTEAEWEYAATGELGRQYPWGELFDPEITNTAEAGPLSTTPVGIYAMGHSPFGVDDMGGNVEELVADEYRPYPGGSLIMDDLALAHGSYRIARGGSFARFGDLARCTRRHGAYQRSIYALGFRLAESL